MYMYNLYTGSKKESLISMPNSFNSGGKYNQFPTDSFKICKVLDYEPCSIIIYILSYLSPNPPGVQGGGGESLSLAWLQ